METLGESNEPSMSRGRRCRVLGRGTAPALCLCAVDQRSRLSSSYGVGRTRPAGRVVIRHHHTITTAD